MSAKLTDVDAEQELLAQCFMEPDLFGELANLSDGFFTTAQTIGAFNAMNRLWRSQKEFTVGAVIAQMGLAVKGLNEAILRVDIQGWIERAGTAADWKFKLSQLALLKRRRELHAVMSEALEKIGQSENPDEILDEVITKGTTPNADIGFVTDKEALNDYFNFMAQNSDDISGVSWSDKWLDERTFGMQPGELYAIAAAGPGAGKSTFAAMIARRLAVRLPVAVFCAEMAQRTYIAREIASASNVALGKVAHAHKSIDVGSHDAIVRGSDHLATLRRFIDCTPLPDYQHMHSRLLKLTRREGQLGLIVLDMLQHVDFSGQQGIREEHAKLGHLMKSLKTLARQMNCPLLLVSQSNRAAEMNALPTVRSLYGSSWIESLCAGVLFLTPLKVWETAMIPAPKRGQQITEDDQVAYWAEHGWRRPRGKGIVLHIEKNRYGPPGFKPMEFDGPTFTFRDCERISHE